MQEKNKTLSHHSIVEYLEKTQIQKLKHLNLPRIFSLFVVLLVSNVICQYTKLV
jgi:hypothetical protein